LYRLSLTKTAQALWRLWDCQE